MTEYGPLEDRSPQADDTSDNSDDQGNGADSNQQNDQNSNDHNDQTNSDNPNDGDNQTDNNQDSPQTSTESSTIDPPVTVPTSSSIPSPTGLSGSSNLNSVPGSIYGATDPSKVPTDIYYPNQLQDGPIFLDDGGCLCALRQAPDQQSTAWRCFGNHSQSTYTESGGKWFTIQDAKAPWQGLPLSDSSNAPNIANAMVLPSNGPSNAALVALSSVNPNPLNVYDKACSGKNQTTFTTSYYGAAQNMSAGLQPIAAAPCYQPGAVPIQIQNVTDWQNRGCLDGFYCPNNTINSLPQYCPPIDLCLEARLAGTTCEYNGVNMGMGPFEPVVCTAGYFCPPGGKEQIKCPSSNYCPLGSSQPSKCAPGSYCPTGSSVEYFILPLVLLLMLDIILIVGSLFLGWYFSMADHRSHRLVHLPAQMGNAVKHDRKGYGKLEDDTEMAEMQPNAAGLRRQPTGFLGSLSGNNKASMQMNLSASSELQAFVESMRKAIQGSNFGLSFGFSQLGFFPKGAQRPVLQDISGSVKAGTLTGVMGGSGAGKSTFVNVLMGKQSHTGGQVTVNGVAGKMKSYKKIIGYVPQDDIVLPELTVRENILHSARIRLPKTWSNKDINSHVDAVVDCLELSHVSSSMVGTVAKPVISGGQRKRVSIGMELAAAPMAVFLDEPTSGLDATAAGSIMRTLKALAKLGISVIVIIHQPRAEIFDMIDKLILLGNGQTIYQGPEEGVKAYFEHFGFHMPEHGNQGDIVTDIITGNGRDYKPHGEVSKEALIEYWKKSNAAPAMEHRNSSLQETASLRASIKKRGAPVWTQAWYCLTRSFLQQYRLCASFWFEMGVAAIGGFLIGLAQNGKKGAFFVSIFPEPYQMLSSAGDYRSAPELALLVCIAVGLIASSPAVKIFAEEKLIYRRESESGHSSFAYYIAKMVSTLPRMILGCLHFTTLFFLLAVPPMSWGMSYWLDLLYFFAIYGLASAVAMVTRREDAPLLAVMASLIVGVLSGASPQLAKVKGWHMEWLWRASPGTWIAEAYWSELVGPAKHIYQTGIATEKTGYTMDQVGIDCAVLLGIGLIYRVLAFGGLLISPRIAS